MPTCVVFHSHVFPTTRRNVSKKLEHVMKLFKHSLNDLSDEDEVCVCLLYLLEKGFNGRLDKQPILEEYFALVSDLDEFSRYHVVNL